MEATQRLSLDPSQGANLSSDHSLLKDRKRLYSLLCFNKGNLISHIFRENEICHDSEWERYFCYKGIEVPDSYTGPRLTFPMTFCGVSTLVEAFKHKQQLHARDVLQILGETWRLLRILTNINHVSVCQTKEITICALASLKKSWGNTGFDSRFRQTWKLLSSHLKMEISDKAITDLAQSIDFNKDGSIDINGFMEAFRLVDLSAHT